MKTAVPPRECRPSGVAEGRERSLSNLASVLLYEVPGVRHFERDLAFIGNNEAKAVLRQIAHYVTTRAL